MKPLLEVSMGPSTQTAARATSPGSERYVSNAERGHSVTGVTPVPVLLMTRELSGVGGIERDVSKFARHLPQYGITPHVACFRPGGARWEEIRSAGLPVLSLPVTSFKSKSAMKAARLLHCYLVENRIQLVHAFDTDADLFGVPLARLFGIPVAITSQVWLRSSMNPLRRLLLALIDRVASGIFVNCEAVARELTTQWKVSPRRIHVCYNGLETEEFNPHGRSRPPKLAGASVVIGTVAVLRKEKNLGLLIEAFIRVRKVDPRAILLIVGSGPMKPALERQARSLHLGDSCVFEEATAKPADWMRAIDIFVLPSSSEAFSNALLEAMGCGCCPVGSRVGGTPELIGDGERGLLFEDGNTLALANQLCELTLDRTLRERMAVRASDYVREYLNIDLAASRLATLYRNLLQRKGSPCADVSCQTQEALIETRSGLERDRLC